MKTSIVLISLLVFVLTGCDSSVKNELDALKIEHATQRGEINGLKGQITLLTTNLAASNEKLEGLRKADQTEIEALKTKLAALQNVSLVEAAVRAEEDQRFTNLTVQIGLTMKSGEAKPVTNTKVVLTRTPNIGLLGTAPSIAPQIGVTDFSGKVIFDKIEHGAYVITCETTLGGGAFLQKRALITERNLTIALNNEDISFSPSR